MPLVNVKLIEGVFTPTQKQEMIRKLTDTMVSIEGENMRRSDGGGCRRGQERRLGNWWQSSHHRSGEVAGRWQVKGLTPPQPLPVSSFALSLRKEQQSLERTRTKGASHSQPQPQRVTRVPAENGSAASIFLHLKLHIHIFHNKKDRPWRYQFPAW